MGNSLLGLIGTLPVQTYNQYTDYLKYSKAKAAENTIATPEEKAEEHRRLNNLRPQDNVKVFTFPKGKKGKLCSFSYKVMSPKASTLKQNVYLLHGKITAAQNSSLPLKEKAKNLANLRCQLKYANSVLSAEVDSIPVNAVIVEENNN